MHVSALSGEYYILADFLRWLNPGLCANSAQVPFIRHWLSGDSALKGNRFAFYSQACDKQPIRRGRSATITNVFRNRRFACAVLGAWLGAGVCVDWRVNQNLSALDRSPATRAARARPPRSAFGLVSAMVLTVVLQLALVTPHIASPGQGGGRGSHG